MDVMVGGTGSERDGLGRLGHGAPPVPPSSYARPVAAPVPTSGRCPARHCWVAVGVDGHAVRWPGLLLEWRRDDIGWQGRVAYVAQLRPDTWVLVEEWLPGEQLTAL